MLLVVHERLGRVLQLGQGVGGVDELQLGGEGEAYLESRLVTGSVLREAHDDDTASRLVDVAAREGVEGVLTAVVVHVLRAVRPPIAGNEVALLSRLKRDAVKGARRFQADVVLQTLDQRTVDG